MNHFQVIDFIILFIFKFNNNAYFLCACSIKRLIDNLLFFYYVITIGQSLIHAVMNS